MKLRSIKIDKKYIPIFNDNRSLPPEEQMVIYFTRIPGTSEKSNYKDYKFDAKGGVQLVYNDQQLVSTFIEKIENLEIDVDGRVQVIRNGAELASANNSKLVDLFTEIRNYLFPDNEELTEGESKA